MLDEGVGDGTRDRPPRGPWVPRQQSAPRPLFAAAPCPEPRPRLHHVCRSHGDRAPMLPLIQFIDIVLNFVWWIIVLGAILSWLIGFNIVNRSNQVVWTIYDSLNRLTEPLYKPIRRLLPSTGAFDFAPLILLFGILFIQIVILGNLRTLAH